MPTYHFLTTFGLFHANLKRILEYSTCSRNVCEISKQINRNRREKGNLFEQQNATRTTRFVILSTRRVAREICEIKNETANKLTEVYKMF